MRRIFAIAVLALMMLPAVAFAVDDTDEATDEAVDAAKEQKDPWVGCWSRLYDAAHLSKHPEQLVTALTIGIDPRTPKGDADPGAYAVRIAASFRNKTDTYTNPETARCAIAGAAKDRLRCFVDGVFLGQFAIDRAGKNIKLALPDAEDELVLVPGIELGAFVRLTPKNKEHSVFLLMPAPPKTCGQ